MIGLALGLALQVGAAQGPYPEVVTRSRLDHSRGVDFHALVSPETVFVGQQATYQLGVFLDQETRQRIRRNPEFLPAETRSLLAYDIPERGGGSFSGTIDGREYEVHVYRRALFPLSPGTYPIPQARLTYAIPQSASFFSREETFTLRSEGVTLVAIEPPAAGRPADWVGAVGVWRASTRLDTSRARAGDPLVLTLRVEGQGNVTLLPRPPLSIPWANLVPSDERSTIDSVPGLMRGAKEFAWLLTPKESGVQRIPALRYVFFSPVTRRYEVATTSPRDVKVAAGDVVTVAREADVATPRTVLPIRASLGSESSPALGDFLLVRVFLGLAPLVALGTWLARRPRRVRRPQTPAERLDAMVRGRAPSTPAEVRRALLDALRSRAGSRAEVLTARGAWTRALRLEGVTPATALEVEALLANLDAGAFGRAAAGGRLEEAASKLLRRVEGEARPRNRVPAAPVAVLLALFVSSAVAAELDRAREPFALGAAAYAGADYVRAARQFGDAAHAAPRAAAAWANFGTASWAAHDTVSAVVGWQRALRLEPTSAELRDRLALVRAPQEIGAARVLTIPAQLPALLALLAWTAGWTLATRQLWRRRTARRIAIATLVFAGAALGAARQWERALAGTDLAVIGDPAPLRSLPALGAETGASPLAGEVARIVERRGVWTRVSLDGDREGWLASERIVPLGRD